MSKNHQEGQRRKRKGLPRPILVLILSVLIFSVFSFDTNADPNAPIMTYPDCDLPVNIGTFGTCVDVCIADWERNISDNYCGGDGDGILEVNETLWFCGDTCDSSAVICHNLWQYDFFSPPTGTWDKTVDDPRHCVNFTLNSTNNHSLVTRFGSTEFDIYEENNDTYEVLLQDFVPPTPPIPPNPLINRTRIGMNTCDVDSVDDSIIYVGFAVFIAIIAVLGMITPVFPALVLFLMSFPVIYFGFYIGRCFLMANLIYLLLGTFMIITAISRFFNDSERL